MKKNAFTMLELIFVIVVMGILAKFGIELLAQIYNNFIYNSVNSSLQEKSQNAVEIVGGRLQYRIKDSIIARQSADDTNFTSLSTANSDDYNILEWVATDIEGFRGQTQPLWSGIIDLDDSNATLLITPETNTTAIDALIDTLSDGNSDLTDAAIYFPGSNTNVLTGYGWQRPAIKFTDQNHTMHPIKAGTNIYELIPRNGDTNDDNNLSGIDVYENYQLAWTAYAVGINNYDDTNKTGTLTLWYDYQPWEGEKYTDGTPRILMEDVSSFRFRALGSVVQIQVCTKSDLVEEYSICKEKTIF
ncbi:type II secretion system protein [Sulfurimonas marina]|uniref:Type II secretion system protein n=1 Tax=Sulfurimonas marina TaxID=2590551 RepID=A0A7M1AWX4_9BACT|nr:type II secretion system protein [Sulfurimonas marina]QOP41940.1 type II secretion system protein [Sulfurimonas marina]